eukprot:TRINITY_DN14669_c0_g1_i1.p1 TRINITY_DN14669_c0_g1~~TRINITY_DN14669_c0_g1_i1.p1  ORF type:complete len:331 (+),score=70.95 TRINITY_DN14669_c0_g1_i1:164-1156(+)
MANLYLLLAFLALALEFAHGFNGTLVWEASDDDDDVLVGNQRSQGSSNDDSSSANMGSPYILGAFCLIGGVALMIIFLMGLSHYRAKQEERQLERELQEHEDKQHKAIMDLHYGTATGSDRNSTAETSDWIMPGPRDNDCVAVISVKDAARLHELKQLPQEQPWDWDHLDVDTVRLHRYDCAMHMPIDYTHVSDRASASLDSLHRIEACLSDIAEESRTGSSLNTFTNGHARTNSDVVLPVAGEQIRFDSSGMTHASYAKSQLSQATNATSRARAVSLDQGAPQSQSPVPSLGLAQPNPNDSLRYKQWLQALHSASNSDITTDANELHDL